MKGIREAMTFAAIGKELGISEQRAKQIYNQAMVKLRRSRTMLALRDMAEERHKIREGRSSV